MMKKVIAGLCMMAATSASADTILGVYVGGSAWDMESNGGFSNETALTTFDVASKGTGSVHIALEHPVPLLPNIKIRQNNLDTTASTTLEQDFTFGSQTFTATSVLSADMDLGNTDYILYYEIFDNSLVSIDLGVNLKNFDGMIEVMDSNSTLNASEVFSGIVPMAYGKAYVGLPFTGWGAFGEMNLLSVSDHKVHDYQFGVEYEFVDNMAIDVSLKLGYRSFKIDLDDLDGVYTDLEFKGAFLATEIHF